MNLRSLIITLAIALSTITTHAQVGIYGKLDINHFSGSIVAGVPAASTWYYGPGVGVYYDFLHLGPVSLGADLRGDLLYGSQSKYRSALFGLRLAAKPPLLPIRPYIQGSVGAGGPRYTGPLGAGINPPGYSTKFQYQIAGGVDFTLLPHLDLRAAEIGYGRMTGINEPVTTMLTISTGLVFRFP
jgi:hypothetical protein